MIYSLVKNNRIIRLIRNGKISDSEITRRETTHRGVRLTNHFLAKSREKHYDNWRRSASFLEVFLRVLERLKKNTL